MVVPSAPLEGAGRPGAGQPVSGRSEVADERPAGGRARRGPINVNHLPSATIPTPPVSPVTAYAPLQRRRPAAPVGRRACV
ncbi:hypothetical protein IEQ44_10000 [Nocardioides sp. Y6]|uniref:Uncharacterized protein n=1 Tax=Nocardioides malaquae TaxID=2773426 RepID=A0ABR9RV41_9ACTN|nr:hypothetical protein [Nocardioides malaquae]MBE7324990.1 hypothetical protein [Nocardioides malaquae]